MFRTRYSIRTLLLGVLASAVVLASLRPLLICYHYAQINFRQGRFAGLDWELSGKERHYRQLALLGEMERVTAEVFDDPTLDLMQVANHKNSPEHLALWRHGDTIIVYCNSEMRIKWESHLRSLSQRASQPEKLPDNK